MFNSKTPSNIEDIPVSEIYTLLEKQEGLPSPKARLNLTRLIFKILGYDLTSDLALALTAEPTAQLIIATAGGGKTTGAQLKVILEKIYRKSKRDPSKAITGDKVLCLVYNKHNVKPMEDKHKQLVSRLMAANIKGLNIDNEINACTMHSFCDQWRKEYVAKLGLMNFSLISDAQQNALIDMITQRVMQKYGILDNNVNSANVLALYNYAKESMKEVEDLVENDKFLDLKLSVEVVKEIFSMYEVMKRNKRKYDFTDMLYCVYNLLKENSDILTRVQRFYDYVVADEVQDFTPIMMSILQLLVNDGTPLLCIGDEDQSIYNFRGADIYNTLNFDQKFDGGEVYLLSRNRRCSHEVLELAKSVIGHNTLRFNKQLNGVKSGGCVEFIPYNSVYGENVAVVSKMKDLKEETLYDSVVCYREKDSSLMLSEMLEEARLPFYVISGYRPLEFELYRHIIQVLDMLESPMDTFNALQLYKVLPIRKKDLFSALKYDPAKRKFSIDHEKKHFSTYDFGNSMNTKGFIQVMERLVLISKNIARAPMNTYFPELYGYLCKYFWQLKLNSLGLSEATIKYLEAKIMSIFNVPETYKSVYEDFARRKEVCRRNQSNSEGLAVSTFHGLKGLEFDNVYVIDMDNDIFPNYALIDSREYSEQTTLNLKECETRLFYVAVTRAKSNLVIYYSNSNPSKYVLDALGLGKQEETEESGTTKEDSKLELADVLDDDFDLDDFAEELPVETKQDSKSALSLLDEFEDVEVELTDGLAETPVTTTSINNETVDAALQGGTTSIFRKKSLLDLL